jgi:hypothetical protein
MISPFKKLLLNAKQRKIFAFYEKNFQPMDDTHPDDIFIAGYPKSGSTWFQSLVAGIVFGVLADKSELRLIDDLIPDIHEDDSFYRRYQAPTFFKTHHKPRPAYRNVVYLLRDGRDVMVSYWHYLQAVQHREVNFLAMTQTGRGLYPCKWHEHVTAWMENPHGARMMVIKYEDLLQDTVAQMMRFCDFAGIKIEPAFLEQVCEASSFENLKKQGTLKGSANGHAAPSRKLFPRRGCVGSYRDEMPPEVQEAFMADAAGVLAQQGYI